MKTAGLFTIGLLFVPCFTALLFAAAPGGPWPRHVIDDSSRGADGVRLADVNGDGLPDIATGWEEGGTIRAYLNPGQAKAAERWPAVTVGRVASPEDAVFVDVDGDGAADVLSCCEGNNRTVYVHWAPKPTAGAPRYLDPQAWTTEAVPATQKVSMWMFALPLQIDGRGGIDLVVGSKGEGAMIGWLQSPERPRDLSAWKLHKLRAAGWIMSLQAHDMDGDGDLDVLASDRKGNARGAFWLENPGAEKVAASLDGKGEEAAWREHSVGARNVQVMFLTRADLDGDGRQDVLAAASGGPIQFLRSLDDRGETWEEHTIAMPPGCGTGKGVAVCDVDGDGKRDVVFTCENAGGKSGARWLSYDKSPTQPVWQDHELSGPEGEKFDRIELADLDADGDPDVITTCEAKANLGVIWYENPSR